MLAALVTAAVLRVAFALAYWTDKPLTHDEHEYLALGESIAEGHGVRYEKADEEGRPAARYGRAPLYPGFIAAVRLSAGPSELVRNVRIAQAALGTMAVWLIALLATRSAGPQAGLAAAWIAAVYPPLVWISAYILSETLYSTLALASVAVLAPVLDGRPAPMSPPASAGRNTLLGGVLAGAAVLVRPAMLFFLLLTGLWLLVRRRVMLLAALTIGALVVVAPWTIRNYREYHRFVLVASEGGITFWTGNNRLACGEGDMAANPAIKLDSQRIRAAHPGWTEEQLEPVFYREAFRAIRSAPLWWAGLLVRKLFYTIVPLGPSYTLHSRRYFVATLVSYGVLLPLGVTGLVLVWHSAGRPRALLLLAASAVLVCVVFLPQERFRIPVIDPALVVGAGCMIGRRGPSRTHER
jgi:4-amino-4-deoxy-L-arabinose transferase-like glycosyltransferase